MSFQVRKSLQIWLERWFSKELKEDTRLMNSIKPHIDLNYEGGPEARKNILKDYESSREKIYKIRMERTNIYYMYSDKFKLFTVEV